MKDADSTHPAKQEQCCRLLEQFLCRLLVPDLLVEYPDLLGTMVHFFAVESYSLSTESPSPPSSQPDQQSRSRSDSAGSTGSRDRVSRVGRVMEVEGREGRGGGGEGRWCVCEVFLMFVCLRMCHCLQNASVCHLPPPPHPPQSPPTM